MQSIPEARPRPTSAPGAQRTARAVGGAPEHRPQVSLLEGSTTSSGMAPSAFRFLRGLAVAEGGPALDARGACMKCRGPLHEMQPKEEDT